MQELDANHLAAAERPVGHQRSFGIHTPEIGCVRRDAADPFVLENHNRIGAERGPAFALAAQRIGPDTGVVRLRFEVKVQVAGLENDDLSRFKITVLLLEGFDVSRRDFWRRGPRRFLRAADKRSDVDDSRGAAGPIERHLLGRQ